MYMKYEISDVTGHVQKTYSNCHMSLIWEMCKTHQNFDAIGNVQEISCVLVLELYKTCEICKTTGNVIFCVVCTCCNNVYAHVVSSYYCTLGLYACASVFLINSRDWPHRSPCVDYTTLIFCLGNIHEMWHFHKLRKCACQVTFPKYQITSAFIQEISL